MVYDSTSDTADQQNAIACSLEDPENCEMCSG